MRRHVIRRLGVLAVIATLVAIATIAITTGSLGHGVIWFDAVRAGGAFVSIALLIWFVFRTTDIEVPAAPDRPRPLPPTKNEIALAYCNVVQTYDSDALRLLANMMIDRPHYLERIHEFVTVQAEVPQLQVTTRQIFRVLGTSRPRPEIGRSEPAPDRGLGSVGQGKVLLVPIVMLEKGTLLDGLMVTDGAGNELPTLSYNQTRGLLAYVVEAIINISPNDPKYANGIDQEVKRRVMANLVTAVCSPTPMKKKDSELRNVIQAYLDTTDELPASKQEKQRIRAFCETFVDHYVIIAEVPIPSGGGHVVVNYRQDISIDSSSLSLTNRLRSRVGLRYSKFDIPLNIFSLDVEAYHMEMDAGHMQYVFDHHLERMNSSVRLAQGDLCRGTSVPYVRLHYNSVGPTMHLYIRRQSAGEPAETSSSEQDAASSGPTERLKSVVEFREIPPGTLGASAVLSVLTAAIIGFFAVIHIGQAPPGRLQTEAISDVPTLVIALPGLASVIIGSWLDLSHLRRASLTTYLSLGASVILSLSSALYYLLDVNKMVPGQLSLTLIGSVMIRTDVGWLVLAGTALTSSLMVVRDLVGSSRYYFNQVKERIRRLA